MMLVVGIFGHLVIFRTRRVTPWGSTSGATVRCGSDVRVSTPPNDADALEALDAVPPTESRGTDGSTGRRFHTFHSFSIHLSVKKDVGTIDDARRR